MAIKVSTGLANRVSDRDSFRQSINSGRLLIFSGTQPTTADLASNGTLLATITNASGAFTAETLPQWTVVLAGSSGSVDSIKMGGVELLTAAIPFTTDLTTTAAAVATAITNNFSLIDYTATSSGANVYIVGPKGCGALLNSVVCAATATTMTATPSSSGAVTTSGVTAVNGLQFSYPASGGAFGISGTWSALGAASGTAAYFRYLADGADAGTSSSTTYGRIDGSITATGGGGDATIDNTAVTSGQTVTVTSFSFGVSLG